MQHVLEMQKISFWPTYNKQIFRGAFVGVFAYSNVGRLKVKQTNTVH